MRVGLFFGSFNPIHVGHLILAASIYDQAKLDKLWFIVSPQNPLKKQANLLHEFDRFDIVRRAIEDDERFMASDIEFSMPKPSYTIDTLTYLKAKHPEHSFELIMGEDNIRNIHKWKNYESILSDYPILVYPRAGSSGDSIDLSRGDVTIVNAPNIEISSTQIRRNIGAGLSIKYLVPENVREYILSNKFYE